MPTDEYIRRLIERAGRPGLPSGLPLPTPRRPYAEPVDRTYGGSGPGVSYSIGYGPDPADRLPSPYTSGVHEGGGPRPKPRRPAIRFADTYDPAIEPLPAFEARQRAAAMALPARYGTVELSFTPAPRRQAYPAFPVDHAVRAAARRIPIPGTNAFFGPLRGPFVQSLVRPRPSFGRPPVPGLEPYSRPTSLWTDPSLAWIRKALNMKGPLPMALPRPAVRPAVIPKAPGPARSARALATPARSPYAGPGQIVARSSLPGRVLVRDDRGNSFLRAAAGRRPGRNDGPSGTRRADGGYNRVGG